MTRIMMRRVGAALVPANSEGTELLGTIPHHTDVAVDVVRLRNGALHRKAFAFLKLAHQLWRPKNFLHAIEIGTVKKLAKFLIAHGLDRAAVNTLCTTFLRALDDSRRGLDIARDFDAFRDFVTIESGFYRTVITPAGPRKEARSWAYKNMDEAEFQQLFQAIRDTCWNLVLSQEYGSIEEADAAAEQLLEFD